MNIHQQPDEDHHEYRPCKNVRSNDIQTKVCEKNKAKPFDDVELIRDLWVDLLMVVMLAMYTGEFRVVEGEVEKEEKGIVDEEACEKLKD